MTQLPENLFRQLVQNAPLVSIDLLIQQNNRYLLGLRQNRPAQGYWFVPGGRILKDETKAQAFQRICQTELQLTTTLDQAQFIGVEEHLYPDSMFDPAVSTHYIVLVYQLQLNADTPIGKDDQHESWQWLSLNEIYSLPKVHNNTLKNFNLLSASRISA